MSALIVIASLPGPDYKFSHRPIGRFVNHLAGDEPALWDEPHRNRNVRMVRIQRDFGIAGFGIFIKQKIRRHEPFGDFVGNNLISSELGYVDYEFALSIRLGADPVA